MSQPALLAVAHGSRNPAATDVIKTLARQVRRLAPVLDVHVAFIGHAEPSLPAELDAAGSNSVIVPLLLSTGYHLTDRHHRRGRPRQAPGSPARSAPTSCC